MASTIPSQERVVDPFASYNSNVVNRITEIVTQNDEGLLTPNSLQVALDSTSPLTSVVVSTGYAVKDDVLIKITQEHTVDFTDSDQWVTAPDILFTGGYCYLVLDYTYARQRPAPQASIKILQPSERNLIDGATTSYILLKVVQLAAGSPHNITAIYDYDPEAGYETHERPHFKTYAGGVANVPSFTQSRDQGRIVYDTVNDEFNFGHSDGWSQAGRTYRGQISSWTYDGVSGFYYSDIDTSSSPADAFLDSWYDDSTGYKISPADVEIRSSGDILRVYFSVNTLTVNYIIQT